MNQQKTSILTSVLILVAAVVYLSVSVSAQDLSVFDLKLNEPFNIPECRYEAAEVPVVSGGGLFSRGKKVKMYRYSEAKPAAGKCFQRVGTSYTMMPYANDPAAKKLPAVRPVTDDKVKLIYADDLKPALATSEDIWIGIENAKLTGVKFYFQNLKANEIYNVLIKKYGKPTSAEDFTIQNGIGGRKDFYKAIWDFPKIKVTFLSLDTNQIGFDPAPPNDQPAGYSSTIGSVMIQYKTSDKNQKDNNPL